MSPAGARLWVDVFTGTVIVSVALALANLTWSLQGYAGAGPAAAPVVPGNGPGTDIRPLVALAPFGTAIAAASEGNDGSVNLRAIFMAVPAEASIVLVAGTDGKVVSYGVGQALGGGSIESIQPEQIVLRTPQGPRVIGFNRPPTTASSPNATASTASAAAAAAGFVAVSPPPAAGGAAAVRAMIPQGLQGGPPPVTSAQSPWAGAPPPASGYRIGAMPNPALVAAGLRPGDVVVKVNGTAVSAGSNERELVSGAMARGGASLEVLRGGQRMTLSVSVN